MLNTACDDDVCECENDCIDVSGFMNDDSSTISNMAALFIGYACQ